MAENGALGVFEINFFVESMETWLLKNVGNEAWIDWHVRLQRLNQQAVLEASSNIEEVTKDTLVSFGKVPILVHEAICIQVWRLIIYPHIMKLGPTPESSFCLYMVLYHEAVVVGLLETVLFHKESMECITEVTIDLVEYAVEQLAALLALLNNGYLEPSAKSGDSENTSEELEKQKQDLQFAISMRCISIVRYIAENMEASGAAASIATNLYKTHDVLSLLAHLLQLEPWRKTDENGDLYVFNYGKWMKPTDEDRSMLHLTEAQLWLTLRQLLLEPRRFHMYTLDDTRRDLFCKLPSKITEVMTDQIPPLNDLRIFLCRLAVGDPSMHYAGGVKNPGCALVELVPQIKEGYIKQVNKKGKSMAKAQLELLRMDGSENSRRMMKKVLEVYSSETALAMDGGGAKCPQCGDMASKKCSRCKNEWYCGRECQVQHWPRHKTACDLLADTLTADTL